MLRLRNVNQKNVLKVVKEMDAFPKVPESYQEKSATSGGCELKNRIVNYPLKAMFIKKKLHCSKVRYKYIICLLTASSKQTYMSIYMCN